MLALYCPGSTCHAAMPLDHAIDAGEVLVAERLAAMRHQLRPANLVLAAQITVRAVSGIMQGTVRRSGGDLPLDLEDELVNLVLRYLLR